MRKINEAAMKSYAKDISDGTDLSSRYIRHATSSKSIDPIALPKEYFEDDEGPSTSKRASMHAAVTSTTSASESMWCEAKSDDGHTYYWNIKTNGKLLIALYIFSLIN